MANKCIIKKSGLTHIKVKEYDYTWTIKNFSHYQLINELTSPSFTTGKNDEYEWKLVLLPSDYINTANEAEAASRACYMALRIGCQKPTSEVLENDVLNNSNTNVLKNVCITISIIDKEGKEVIIKKKLCDKIELIKSVTACYFTKFLNRNYVFDENNRFLPNDQLTIVCKLYFYEVTETVSYPYSAIEEMPSKCRLEEFDQFEELLESEKFTDVKLIIGDKEFCAHKCILSARSCVFSDLFKKLEEISDSDRVEVYDINCNVMKEVLRFIYAGKVNNLKDNCRDLLTAAVNYQLVGLKLVCEELMINELSVENVYESLILVNNYDVKVLEAATIAFVCTHAKDLVNTKEFQENIQSLSASLLSTLIQAMAIK